jgi:hypothetical protein
MRYLEIMSIFLDDPHSLYNPHCKRVQTQPKCRGLVVNPEGGNLCAIDCIQGIAALERDVQRCRGAMPSPIDPPASFAKKIVQR